MVPKRARKKKDRVEHVNKERTSMEWQRQGEGATLKKYLCKKYGEIGKVLKAIKREKLHASSTHSHTSINSCLIFTSFSFLFKFSFKFSFKF